MLYHNTLKTCSSCKKALPLSEYWKLKSSKDGLQYRCKSCLRIAMGAKKREPFEIRFWSRVDTSGGPLSCWNWTGYTAPNGYAFFGGKPAHRIAWELMRGPVDKGTEVCHDCPDGDNPRCCNPNHCFLGSHADNMADAAKKDRIAFGERKSQARLTEASVREIREKYARGSVLQRELAEEYGVSRLTIGDAISGRTWRRVV